MKYVYPALFTPEPEGGFCVVAPDLPGCVTSADTLAEGVEKIRDGIGGMLFILERDKRALPQPSSPQAIQQAADDFIALVDVDLEAYKRSQSERAVRRTVSLPEWLDNAAVNAGISLSKVLQEALKQQLNS